MKMKKLLSTGALVLLLASSTTIGAFAADRPSNDKIKADLLSVFLNNKSPLTYNVTKNTKVKQVVDKSKVSQLQNDLKNCGLEEVDYSTLLTALSNVDPSTSIVDNVKAILTDDAISLDKLLSESRSLAQTLRDIENSDVKKRVTIEGDIAAIVESANASLDVAFGKNAEGKLTMTITQSKRIILQLNSGNAYTISNSLGDSEDKIIELAKMFNLISDSE